MKKVNRAMHELDALIKRISDPELKQEFFNWRIKNVNAVCKAYEGFRVQSKKNPLLYDQTAKDSIRRTMFDYLTTDCAFWEIRETPRHLITEATVMVIRPDVVELNA